MIQPKQMEIVKPSSEELNIYAIVSITILFGTAIVSVMPISSALILGSDEGFELVKAFLEHRGFHLYSQIWSDQPPLFTSCLDFLFKIGGEFAIWTRLLTTLLGGFLLGCLYEMVRYRSRRVAAAFAILLLASAPAYLSLSVSVMQEVPAFAFAMASAWCLFRWENSKGWHWLTISGALLMVALLIKFTAGLILPAMAIEFILVCKQLEGTCVKYFKSACFWFIGILAAFETLSPFLDFGDYNKLVGSHTTAIAIEGMSKASDFPFPLLALGIEHWEVWLCAVIGIRIIFVRRIWREVAFPITLLFTVTIVHLAHRPWWYYYYLHHAIPLVWLSGIAIRELMIRLKEIPYEKTNSILRSYAAAFLIALLILRSGTRVMGEVKEARNAPKIQGNAMLAHIA